MSKNKIEIIYSDDDIFVINKPSGISVTKDRGGDADLMETLDKQLPEGSQNLRLIHRLDKLTSGVMVIAKNIETQSKFSSDFELRKVKKTYLAIINGFVSRQNGVINKPMGRYRKDTTRMTVDKHGKKAQTYWRLIAEFGLMSLVAVRPVTGRTHQIRVHLASIGMNLAIDPLYGGGKSIMLSDFKRNYRLGKSQEEKPLIDRLTLHSYQLELPGYEQKFVARLDKKFAAAIKMLVKHIATSGQLENDQESLDRILSSQTIDFEKDNS